MLWINIKKDKPKEDGDYIVNIKNGLRNTNVVCVLHYYGEKIGWCSKYEGVITHWMPFPDRPNVKD